MPGIRSGPVSSRHLPRDALDALTSSCCGAWLTVDHPDPARIASIGASLPWREDDIPLARFRTALRLVDSARHWVWARTPSRALRSSATAQYLALEPVYDPELWP